jgi:CubicO group peptidase (beta-lactamase class C family)
MFERITPEQAGISSRNIERMISFLERNGYVFHSLLLMKGDALFGEYYWKPFNADFCHRMYSQTKSYVGIAIGLLAEEEKLSLDDPIVKYFPDKLDKTPYAHLAAQTVRDMLSMRTAVRPPNWFTSADPDRTHEYLNEGRDIGPAGTVWAYDSAGSQVLASLVERLAGMSLFDYLNEKIFRHLDTFRTATVLKTPSGDSWGDSALICTSRDMASFARLLCKGGMHEGKRLIPEEYLRQACSRVTYNHETAFSAYDEAGYGYQIWQTQMGGFAFHGMGGQFSIGIPELDFTVVVTGDNQGHRSAGQLLFAAIEEFLVLDMSSTPLPTDDAAYASLAERTADLRLAACAGEPVSEMATEIDGQTYEMGENPYGWKWFSFALTDGASGVLRYENAQGEKELPFAFGENIFCKFPQYGYSDGVGGVRTTDGFLYDCAVSAGWLCANVLSLRVQIIDRYFGNLFMMFAFKGDEVAISMVKNAENFLNEYHGRAMARRRKDVAVTGL